MDNKSSGTPGQSGPVFTAAFTQPISSPESMPPVPEPIPGAFEQKPGPIQPAQPMSGEMPGVAPQMPSMEQNPVTGQPIMSQPSAPVAFTPKKDIRSLVKTIAIIALSLVSLTFIGLFIWMYTQYDAARTDVDGQIAKAVVAAREEVTMKLEDEFAEREKDPYRTFAGPIDYGELTFEYPKTWSVYVANDATDGGDFEAYFNPIQVGVVSDTTIDALSVSILNKAIDEVAAEYQKYLEEEEPTLKLESVTIGQNNDIVANRYTGIIPDTEFSGYIVVFKLRDKTVILQTDSVLFENDFNTLLSTVRFNA